MVSESSTPGSSSSPDPFARTSEGNGGLFERRRMSPSVCQKPNISLEMFFQRTMTNQVPRVDDSQEKEDAIVEISSFEGEYEYRTRIMEEKCDSDAARGELPKREEPAVSVVTKS